MIVASSPPASWTLPVVALWSSCVVVTGALWLASAPLAPHEEAAVVVDVPADGEEERDFAAAADANVFGAANVVLDWAWVPRAEIDEATTALDTLSNQHRMVPVFESGRAIGFRLFSLREDSFLAHRGFKGGDIISRINGYDMTSPEKALEAYSSIKAAIHVVVEGRRDGHPTTWRFIVEKDARLSGGK